MSKKQPKLKFEEEKERTATRSPPKKSKVEQSVPQKQKLKQDAGYVLDTFRVRSWKIPLSE